MTHRKDAAKEFMKNMDEKIPVRTLAIRWMLYKYGITVPKQYQGFIIEAYRAGHKKGATIKSLRKST